MISLVGIRRHLSIIFSIFQQVTPVLNLKNCFNTVRMGLLELIIRNYAPGKQLRIRMMKIFDCYLISLPTLNNNDRILCVTQRKTVTMMTNGVTLAVFPQKQNKHYIIENEQSSWHTF